MKAAVAMNPKYYVRRRAKAKPYPNATEKPKTLDRVLDTVLSFTLCVAAVTILLFVLALG